MPIREEILDSEKIEINSASVPKALTVLPLRDIIIFPNMIFPILIGRNSSLKAISAAVERDKFIFVASQRNPTTEEPGFEDIYQYGTTAKILQILRLPNNLLKVLVEGIFQSKIKKVIPNEEYLEAEISHVFPSIKEFDQELYAMVRHSSELFEHYVKANRNLPPDIATAFAAIEDPQRKLFFAAAYIEHSLEERQRILEKKSIKKQYMELIAILKQETELQKLEDEIDVKVQDSIQKTQRKFYIQEQIRTLQKELEDDDEQFPDLAPIRKAIDECGMPEAVAAKAIEEFEKLKKIPSLSPEHSVNRSYLETLVSLPWSARTADNMDIENVRSTLDEDHFGLEKPKERILEYISILNLSGSLKRQILCFVGPPGVGKTSLGRSIARALGRKFVRFSLGGVRDEAEIRGHRRTYIGALPGKIISSMKKAGTVNPVILLDEIDKMSMDFRGDPSSALLEVLDPEQNVAFNDHFLEVDYDLSNVLFITTANVRYDIPLPLQDRMEIIELESYLDLDKLQIARKHILPRLLEEYSLSKFKIEFADEALMKIIREYTRESGVRSLERQIGAVLRKLAKEIVIEFNKSTPKAQAKGSDDAAAVCSALCNNDDFVKLMKKKKIRIDSGKVEEFLKAPRYRDRSDDLAPKVGQATGLAWTSVGGDTLPVEVSIMPGAEKLTLTGNLGDVMKESAQAALTFVRSNWKEVGVEENFYEKREIHLHVPEGAIPKDGPSAGITIAIALISAASGWPVRGDVAMTGEITLRGNILAIGGLNEKLLAAKRLGIKKVLIPSDNMRDVEDIKPEIKSGLEIIAVKTLVEALPHVFSGTEEEPKPKKARKK